jgi:hypothetical protein
MASGAVTDSFVREPSMSRSKTRILNASEQQHLNQALIAIGLEFAPVSKRRQVAIYDRFCHVSLARLTDPHKLEDQTLLLRMLIKATFTPQYKKEVQKDLLIFKYIFKEILKDIKFEFSWITELLKDGDEK